MEGGVRPVRAVKKARESQRIHLENPSFYCSSYSLSRVQVASEDQGLAIRRSVFYACAIGGCNFFDYMQDNEGGGVLMLGHGNLPEEQMRGSGL